MCLGGNNGGNNICETSQRDGIVVGIADICRDTGGFLFGGCGMARCPVRAFKKNVVFVDLNLLLTPRKNLLQEGFPF